MPKSVPCRRWKCGRCHRAQEHTGLLCRSCHSPKSLGTSLVALHGDWGCQACGENNFARRTSCWTCGRKRGVNAQLTRPGLLGVVVGADGQEKEKLQSKEAGKEEEETGNIVGGNQETTPTAAATTTADVSSDRQEEDDDDDELLRQI